jgi:hypothetical protein
LPIDPAKDPGGADFLGVLARVSRAIEGRAGSVTIHFTEGKPRKLEYRFIEALERDRAE